MVPYIALPIVYSACPPKRMIYKDYINNGLKNELKL